MNYKRLICYYSDLYRGLKKEVSLRMIVIDNLGYVVYRKNKKIKEVDSVSSAKYITLNELINSLSELEKTKYSNKQENIYIDIISFDKKVIPSFINIDFVESKVGIDNINILRDKLSLHTNWNIRYDNKSKDIFQKVYAQSSLGKGKKRLKGFKLPRKKVQARKVKDAMGNECKNLVFFDVEMNCVDKKDNILGYWEIISIGAVKYNIENKEVDKFYSVIKPKIQKTLSSRCKQITGLTQEEIDKGIDFKESMSFLEKWVGNGKSVFISWGREDIKAFKSNSKLLGNQNQLINQIRKSYVDFQKEFSYYYEKMNQVVSLTNAIESCKMEFEGTQHNALNDAYNLYRVYEKYSNI